MMEEHDGGTEAQLELFKFLARSCLTQGTGVALRSHAGTANPRSFLNFVSQRSPTP